MAKNTPEFILIPIAEIELLNENPREINQKEFKELCKDIKHDPNFLMQRPPLINLVKGKNICYAGNQRVKAAIELGYTEIHVWREKNVSKDLQDERMMKDNLHRGEWNMDLLKNYDTSFLMNVGFKPDQLNGFFNDILSLSEDEFNVEKALEEIKEPTTKPGDLFILGNHKLLCGDSTLSESTQRLFGEEKAQIVYCDPPYNIGFNYKGGFGKGERYTNTQVKDNKSSEEYAKFISATLSNALSVAEKDVHVFYWCDENYIGLLQQAMVDNGAKNSRVCFWIKNSFNPVPQKAFNKLIEPCVYAVRGNPFLNKEMKNLHEILNPEIGGNNIIDDFMSYTQLWAVPKENQNNYQHPTQKPIRLHEKPLKRCSSPNDLVIDLFGGSGSTLIACEQLKRRAYLIEKDPVSCDVIIQRWEQLTGLKAILCK